MISLNLQNAGIGWQVQEWSSNCEIASTWSFFSRSEAIDFLGDRYKKLKIKRNTEVDISGVCFSELDLDPTASRYTPA